MQSFSSESSSGGYTEIIKGLSRSKLSILLVIGVFIVLTFIENRVGIVQLATLGSQGIPVSYSTNIIQAFASPSLQVEILPGLILAQAFSLPPYSVLFFFYLLYHAASGIFMVFFIYRYLNLVIGGEKTIVRLAISLGGGLIYSYFPYNILGDNFPELFFLRSLLPLFFLLIMEFMESRKITLFALSAVLLGYMTILDPRAIIFVPTLTFFFLVLPKIAISAGIRLKITIFFTFILGVMLSYLISSFTLTPRITTAPVSTAIGVPFVQEAFRYTYSNMLNTLGGLSFEGTFLTSSLLPFGVSYYLICGLCAAIVAFSVIFAIKYTGKRLAVYFLTPTLFTLALLAVFVSFDGSPFFQKLLFSDYSSSLPEAVKTVALLFRTPRFTNITLALVYSIFSCLSLVLFFKFLKIKDKALRFFSQNQYHVIVVDRNIFLKKGFATILVFLFLISVISSVGMFTSSGSAFGDLTGERAKAYSEVDRIYGNNQSSILTVPYSSTSWDFTQALVAPSESVMRYIYAYALDPSIPTSLLSRNQTSQLDHLLSMAGIRYLVVDEYSGNQKLVIDIMNHSSSLVYFGQIGQLSIFKVNNLEEINLGTPVYVLGGLETYFKTVESIEFFSSNTTFAPIFMDGPISWQVNDLQSFGPIFSSPNKSILDLIGSFMVVDPEAIVVSPSQYTSHFAPPNYWSPAFVSDTHQGVWTYYLGEKIGYDWDYSYNPSYGFAFTWGTATLDFNFQTNQSGSYSVFVRSLHHPENGTVQIGLDSTQTLLNTGWNSSSTEFVWDSLGDYNLTKGSHKVNITNVEGLGAVNLVVVIPSEKVRQLDSIAQQFYSYAGDVKIPNRVAIDNSSRNVNYSMNIISQGNYSALISLTVDKPDGNSVQLVVNNQTYQTQVVSLNPYVVFAENIALPVGNQSIELVSSRRFEASNISVIVYGPIGSLADDLFSWGQNKSQVDAGNLIINEVSIGYYETSITFNATSIFMLVLPQLYTGTMRVAFDSKPNNISYSIYPISDVFTGIWFSLPNGTSHDSFTATFFTEEGRALKQSNENAVLLAITLLVVAIVIDLIWFIIRKKNKYGFKLRNN